MPTEHDITQLAMFLNRRDVRDYSTLPWDELGPPGQEAYLKDSTAVLRAVEALGWTPPTSTSRSALANALPKAAQLRGAVRFLGPAEMTPEAALVLDRVAESWELAEPNPIPPSDAEVAALRAVLNHADVDYSAREQRADAGGGELEPGDWFTFIARAALEALRAPALSPHSEGVTRG